MSKADQSHELGHFVMRGFVICDDVVLIERVVDMLRRVGRQAGANVRWRVKYALADDLGNIASGERALLEASDAHLLTIPAGFVHSPPAWLRLWLKRWAALRQIRDAALAVISDGQPDKLELQVHLDLAEFIQQNGLAFITERPSQATPSAMLSIQFTSNHQVPLLIEARRSNNFGSLGAYRDFGINE